MNTNDRLDDVSCFRSRKSRFFSKPNHLNQPWFSLHLLKIRHFECFNQSCPCWNNNQYQILCKFCSILGLSTNWCLSRVNRNSYITSNSYFLFSQVWARWDNFASLSDSNMLNSDLVGASYFLARSLILSGRSTKIFRKSVLIEDNVVGANSYLIHAVIDFNASTVYLTRVWCWDPYLTQSNVVVFD